MFKRAITPILTQCAKTFPVTVLTGPRQGGKTTLLQSLFPQHHYYSLETPDVLSKIRGDPRAFLEENNQGIIFDEAQAYPELFSYIQTYVDQKKQPGQFILSGSQNFLLLEKVSQTLAGRAALLELLPLSYQEYITWEAMPSHQVWEHIFYGGYPRPYEQDLDWNIWFNSYIQTYLERDVRSLLNISDIVRFRQFISLCAGRHGQLLNISEIANDAGVSHTTAAHWLSLLESSYIVFRLPPYFKNFNKRIIKSPKLYFYDSGLVCQLLGIESPNHLKQHAMRGALFEGYYISEVVKHYTAQGKKPPIYFWRDRSGHEVDLLIDRAGDISIIEIKSGQTWTPDMLKGLAQWQKITQQAVPAYLIYAGSERFTQRPYRIFPWHTSPDALVK